MHKAGVKDGRALPRQPLISVDGQVEEQQSQLRSADAAAEVAMLVAAASADQTRVPAHQPVRRTSRAADMLQVLSGVLQGTSGRWSYPRLPDMALRPSVSDSMMAMARLISSYSTLLGQGQPHDDVGPAAGETRPPVHQLHCGQGVCRLCSPDKGFCRLGRCEGWSCMDESPQGQVLEL